MCNVKCMSGGMNAFCVSFFGGGGCSCGDGR